MKLLFDGFFAEMFDLEPMKIEEWDIVIFTHVTKELRNLGIYEETEYILLEKFYKGAIYIRVMDYYDEIEEYNLSYVEYPHEDVLFKTGRTFESMQYIDSELSESISELKKIIDREDIPEFLHNLSEQNLKNRIQTSIDCAIDEGNFERAKELMDEYGGLL